MGDPETGSDRVDIAYVTVYGPDEDDPSILVARRGEPLRDVLVRNGHSPYTDLTRRSNCGGRGLCATCGVRLGPDAPAPEHWHDRLAARFGYPRLSCQVRVKADLTVEIPDKRVWGGREDGPTAFPNDQ